MRKLAQADPAEAELLEHGARPAAPVAARVVPHPEFLRSPLLHDERGLSHWCSFLRRRRSRTRREPSSALVLKSDATCGRRPELLAGPRLARARVCASGLRSTGSHQSAWLPAGRKGRPRSRPVHVHEGPSKAVSPCPPAPDPGRQLESEPPPHGNPQRFSQFGCRSRGASRDLNQRRKIERKRLLYLVAHCHVLFFLSGKS